MKMIDYDTLLQSHKRSGHLSADANDVCCEYCGSACPIELPADIPFMRSKQSWCCEVCEHAMWREHNSK